MSAYTNRPKYLCSKKNDENAYLKIERHESGLLVPSRSNAEQVLKELPIEFNTKTIRASLDNTFLDIETHNSANLNTTANPTSLPADTAETYSPSKTPSCSFYHAIPENRPDLLYAWSKAALGLDELAASEAFDAWNTFAKYEHDRQTSRVLMKPLKKPKIIIAHISELADREKLAGLARNNAERAKFNELSGAMSLQGQFDFTFFEGYKSVPCGVVAFSFKELIFVKDIGAIIRGAKFFPEKLP